MAKRQINIKESVNDIRKGMSDAALMAKHRLDAYGLQSLFNKLVSIKAIEKHEIDQRMPEFTETVRWTDSPKGAPRPPTARGEKKAAPKRKRKPPTIKAKEAIMNIRAGMSDGELMEKYRLSSKGLKNLYDQLLKADLIEQWELDLRNPAFDSTVDVSNIVNEMKRNAQLTPEKSEPKRLAVLRQGPTNLHALSRDVRLGLSDMDLMEKYRLSYDQLQKGYEDIIRKGIMSRGELFGRSSLLAETISLPVDYFENKSAAYLAFPVPVYEAGKPGVVGRIRNMTERDLGLIGIRARVDDLKTLVISPEKFAKIQPFSLDAECLWSEEKASGEYVAGFEIVSISRDNLAKLRSLIELLTLGGSKDK